MSKHLYPTQRSTLYRKFRMSKYDFPTHIIAGSGNSKGKLVVGSQTALVALEAKIGRKISLHHLEKSRGQFIFCELR